MMNMYKESMCMFYKIVNKIKSLFKKKKKPIHRPKMLINWNGTDYTYDEFFSEDFIDFDGYDFKEYDENDYLIDEDDDRWEDY